jgi:glutaredoxin
MITVYSKPSCTYCEQAKKLLMLNKLSYNEVMLDVGQPRVDGQEYVDLAEFKKLYPEAKTAPQIIIEGVRIGGFSELKLYIQMLQSSKV